MTEESKTPPTDVIWNQVQVLLGKIRSYAARLEGLIDGSNADSLHVHTTTGLSDITNGTFTPTASNLSNADSVTFSLCTYARIGGGAVLMSGEVTIDPTAAGAVSFTFDLPVSPASNFSAYTEMGGTAALQNASNTAIAHIRADTGGTKLGRLSAVTSFATARSLFFICMWRL